MWGRLRTLMYDNEIRIRPLYSITIFLSAFLLFEIQPMIARYLLPFFGGSVSVWAAGLAFFTSLLFFGYAYVYTLSRLTQRTQATIHGGLLGVVALCTLATLIFGDPYFSFEWVFSTTDIPALQVLISLAVCIGAPYFLLSTTGPLLQHWYARDTGKEPYHLYAVSNIGALLALGTYPFLIEPSFGLSLQQILWSLALFVCITLLVMITRRHHSVRVAMPLMSTESPALWTIVTWVGFAALPTAMLVATTARITQTLTPFPFLWIVPLALYLLSFIFAFRGWGRSGLTSFALLVTAVISYVYLDFNFSDTPIQILANLALFFFGSLYCHALLYTRRPTAHASAVFYLWISLGGSLGTLVVTFIAPLVFVDVLEFSIGIAVFALLAVAAFPTMRYVRDEYKRETIILRTALLIGVFLFSINHFSNIEDTSLSSSRNFFGVVHVYDYADMRSLQHGTTVHGTQFRDEAREREATTYYSPTSGVGRAIVNAKAIRGRESIAVGVIGLGAGTLAAYCERDDTFTFYEIDGRVGQIANEFFTYLSGCPNVHVTYGDGRLSLQRELEGGKRGNFDVLAIDAFSDDTIPVHLLTKEALELYMMHLRSSESILAIHTSNRFFELAPVVMKIAVELGVSAMVITDRPSGTGASHSQWVLLSKDAAVLQEPIFAKAATFPPLLISTLWTDDYANVFASLDSSALKFWESDSSSN